LRLQNKCQFISGLNGMSELLKFGRTRKTKGKIAASWFFGFFLCKS
jgi:hypothetical protein